MEYVMGLYVRLTPNDAFTARMEKARKTPRRLYLDTRYSDTCRERLAHRVYQLIKAFVPLDIVNLPIASWLVPHRVPSTLWSCQGNSYLPAAELIDEAIDDYYVEFSHEDDLALSSDAVLFLDSLASAMNVTYVVEPGSYGRGWLIKASGKNAFLFWYVTHEPLRLFTWSGTNSNVAKHLKAAVSYVMGLQTSEEQGKERFHAVDWFAVFSRALERLQENYFSSTERRVTEVALEALTETWERFSDHLLLGQAAVWKLWNIAALNAGLFSPVRTGDDVLLLSPQKELVFWEFWQGRLNLMNKLRTYLRRIVKVEADVFAQGIAEANAHPAVTNMWFTTDDGTRIDATLAAQGISPQATKAWITLGVRLHAELPDSRVVCEMRRISNPQATISQTWPAVLAQHIATTLQDPSFVTYFVALSQPEGELGRRWLEYLADNIIGGWGSLSRGDSDENSICGLSLFDQAIFLDELVERKRSELAQLVFSQEEVG